MEPVSQGEDPKETRQLDAMEDPELGAAPERRYQQGSSHQCGANSHLLALIFVPVTIA